jgi:Xaa-Pro aminopeptidase
MSFSDRIERARTELDVQDVDAMLLSVGADLPYLTGYSAMATERLTMLVLPREGDAKLVIAGLEAPLVKQHDDFDLVPWGETEDPLNIVNDMLAGASTVAVGDTMWAKFLVGLVARDPSRTYRNASEIMTPLRARKTVEEIDRLRAASHAVDRIAVRLQAGEIALVGQTEAAVSAELSRQIIEEGHGKVNFAIVAAGENASSPHHHASDRVIRKDEVVLCDFGGTMFGDDGVGYCSDLTRCVYTGTPPSDFAEMYDVLFDAQAASVAAATVGTPAEDVDRVGRDIISSAGYGDYFIHRTGHGIGVEAHEEPYIVEGNSLELEAGNAFSVEPGIYIPGKWGARLEDIVVAAEAGPDPLNLVDHHLAIVG